MTTRKTITVWVQQIRSSGYSLKTFSNTLLLIGVDGIISFDNKRFTFRFPLTLRLSKPEGKIHKKRGRRVILKLFGFKSGMDQGH